VAAKKIVVVGGGFAGVYAARHLEKTLRPEEAEISLVNRENYFVFQPLLPEVISGSIGLVDTVSPIRRLCPRTRLYTREIESIDLQRQVVALAPAVRPRSIELHYDCLVLAPGTVTDLSGMPGMAEHALPFRTLGDALRLRNRALLALEEADNEADPEFRKHLLTFVVTGGGFSGVEVIAELNDFLRRATRHFPNVPPAEIRCVLVHSGEKILPEMAPKLAEYAQGILTRRGVELKLKARVVRATQDSAFLNTGETIFTRTVVSTVPSGPVPLVATLDCAKEKGKLLANPFLELQGYEGRVWVVGDCASIRMPDGTNAQPTAQHAVREARTVAGNIAATLRGGEQKVFAFGGLGKLGSLGHNSAVAEVLGIRMSGLPAWFLWRTIYWMKMPGLERKLRVGLDWATAFILGTELVQLKIQASDNITAEHFEPGEVIFEQGDAGDRLYVIRKGSVDVFRDGTQVAHLAAGEYFGEMALMSMAARTATVKAAEPTDVLAVAKGDFSKLLANFPEFREGLTDLAMKRTAKP
jgi:NADH:ubiquinone reductase (H+-translocating)